jgi:hypothetical protein
MYMTNAFSYHTYNTVLHGLLEVYSVNIFPFLVVVFHYDSTFSGKVWYFFLGNCKYIPLDIDYFYHVYAFDIISFIIGRGFIRFREWCGAGRARLVVF